MWYCLPAFNIKSVEYNRKSIILRDDLLQEKLFFSLIDYVLPLGKTSKGRRPFDPLINYFTGIKIDANVGLA